MQYLIILVGLVWLFDSAKPYIPVIIGIAVVAMLARYIQKQSEKNKRDKRDEMVINRLMEESSCLEEEESSKQRDTLVAAFKSRDSINITSTISAHLSIEIVNDFISTHYDALKKDYKRHVRTDAYGVADEKNWLKILEGIVEAKLYRKYLEKVESYQAELLEYEFYVLKADSKQIKEEIKEMAQDLSSGFKIEYEYREDGGSLDSTVDLDAIEDGFDYEHAIAAHINESLDDWNAEVTQGTGDQGVDVLAVHNNGTIVAIQCKLYSQPVGNQAVQEVNAGRAHYGADYAFVVTNNKFTKSACLLASSCNVELLHHDALIEELQSIVN